MARLNVGWLFALSLAACAGCSVDTSGLMPSDAIPGPDASSVFLDASAPDATTPLDSSPGANARPCKSSIPLVFTKFVLTKL